MVLTQPCHVALERKQVALGRGRAGGQPHRRRTLPLHDERATAALYAQLLAHELALPRKGILIILECTAIERERARARGQGDRVHRTQRSLSASRRRSSRA